MRVSGLRGELRVGYQQAVALGEWTITPSEAAPHAFAFHAHVLSQHSYWSTQRPMDLVLALGTTEWRWSHVSPRVSGESVSLLLTRAPLVLERAEAPRVGGAAS